MDHCMERHKDQYKRVVYMDQNIQEECMDQYIQEECMDQYKKELHNRDQYTQGQNTQEGYKDQSRGQCTVVNSQSHMHRNRNRSHYIQWNAYRLDKCWYS